MVHTMPAPAGGASGGSSKNAYSEVRQKCVRVSNLKLSIVPTSTSDVDPGLKPMHYHSISDVVMTRSLAKKHKKQLDAAAAAAAAAAATGMVCGG